MNLTKLRITPATLMNKAAVMEAIKNGSEFITAAFGWSMGERVTLSDARDMGFVGAVIEYGPGGRYELDYAF
jgi:hypothetical protein